MKSIRKNKKILKKKLITTDYFSFEVWKIKEFQELSIHSLVKAGKRELRNEK